jgi:hypothetical protein
MRAEPSRAEPSRVEKLKHLKGNFENITPPSKKNQFPPADMSCVTYNNPQPLDI